MAPGPVHQQQFNQSETTNTTSSTSTNLQQQGNTAIPTQEETQVCTRLMSTLLECGLREALAAEAVSNSAMKIYYEESDKTEFVTCYDRDRMVRWLCVLTHGFHYCLEVFFRATSILDSFLSVLKVRPKFLQCVTATCFFAASKLEEKPQSVETVVSDLVRNYSCAFTPRDIHRMELIIVQKLDFKITTNTPYDFLKIFHVLGITNGSLSLPAGLSHDQHLCHTALCMEEIVCNHTLMKFRPSLLALAVLGCDLKLLGCDWLTAVVTLQNLSGVRGRELSVCYEAVAPQYNVVATRHPLYIEAPTATSEEEEKDTSAVHAPTSTKVKEADKSSVSKVEVEPSGEKGGSKTSSVDSTAPESGMATRKGKCATKGKGTTMKIPKTVAV